MSATSILEQLTRMQRRFWTRLFARANINLSSELRRTTRLLTAFMKVDRAITGNAKFFLGLTAFLLLFSTNAAVFAQDNPFSDGSADPVKLFERGQNAHAHGQLEKALEFYDEAIRVRPEFPEAEYQRATALVTLNRLTEAERGFKRAIELRKNWSLPYSGLGALLVRLNRDAEAEPVLREAIKLDAQNFLAVRMLADVRFRAGDHKQALEFARIATNDAEAPASIWLLRGLAEHATKDNAGAVTSLTRAIELDPANFSALMERAEIRIGDQQIDLALSDLKTAESLIKDDKPNASRVAVAYQAAGRTEDAQRIARSAGLTGSGEPEKQGGLKVVGTPEEIEAANSDDPQVARKALEQLLLKNPDNANLLARLGAAYRTIDPAKSLEYYKRALTLEPRNSEYATGYGSALVQARRFSEAAALLRQVVTAAPENPTAHANLATALYELKQFGPALNEYEWLKKSKPDLAVIDYFIATAHDSLGEYNEALTAYESFLARADSKTNQLEIEKVKLRLPSLKRQIQLGQGAKRSAERRN
jgi:tetratricopeptide (TPR) repeat protein